MSLDVYLQGDEIIKKCTCSHCWNEHEHKYREELFWANITHNLNGMADEGGFYEAVWRPEQNGITEAKQLIPILKKAIEDMKAEPERFKRHEPENGWGNYDGFLSWLERYLEACRNYPDANVGVSR